MSFMEFGGSRNRKSVVIQELYEVVAIAVRLMLFGFSAALISHQSELSFFSYLS